MPGSRKGTMSRTDKDVPYWVDAEYWEPYHYRCGNSYRTYWGVTSTPKERECNLPVDPPPIRQHREVKKKWGWRECYWEPAWAMRRDCHGRDRSRPHVPHWYVDHVGNAPSRVRLRDDCRQAAKEYRATGEVDIIPPTYQHRHCAMWLWW